MAGPRSPGNACAVALSGDIPPSLQFLFDTFPEKVVFVTKELCLADEALSAIPHVLRNFSMLQRYGGERRLHARVPASAGPARPGGGGSPARRARYDASTGQVLSVASQQNRGVGNGSSVFW